MNILKRYWKLIAEIVGVLMTLISIKLFSSLIFDQCEIFIDNISQIMNISPVLTVTLFVLFVLCIVTLTFSLLCIFHVKIKRKHKIEINDDIKKIIRFASDKEYFSKTDLIKKYSLNKSELNVNLINLLDAGIIHKYTLNLFINDWLYWLKKHISDNGLYYLSDDGDKYAIKNKLT